MADILQCCRSYLATEIGLLARTTELKSTLQCCRSYLATEIATMASVAAFFVHPVQFIASNLITPFSSRT